MKKILGIVSYTFLPATTGGHKAIASMYQSLSRFCSVVVIGTKTNDAEKARGYRMIDILSNSPLRYINPFNFFTIRALISKEKPDYLQIEHPYLGWLAVLLKKFSGIKLIVRSHNIEGLRFKDLGKWWWKMLLSYEGWVHRKADINYFISETDKVYAVGNFRLSPSACYTITYGVNFTSPPSIRLRESAKDFLIREHLLDKSDTIILFNGAFGYGPNARALSNLINNIFPLIYSITRESFKLIICGKDIPAILIENNVDKNIIFAGFVADINTYLTGASIFVNPITEGGGIKTKLVEALAFNVTCVSFKTGALGVPQEVCGEKLVLADDNDFEAFAEAIVAAKQTKEDIPSAFYKEFANEKIVEKMKSIL